MGAKDKSARRVGASKGSGFLWGKGAGKTGEQLCMLAVLATNGYHRFGPAGTKLHDMSRKAVSLSYSDNAGHYGSGWDDAYFVVHAVALLTALRVIVNNAIFRPLARMMGVKERKVPKFMAQGWNALYYACAFYTGLTIMYEEWGFSVDDLFNSYPATTHTPKLKLYYLVQLAYWFHMIFVTIIEPWLKDFPVMMAHHLITSFLVGSSYSMNYVRIGTAILVEQDFADIFLPIAKAFLYAKHNTLADVFFATFAITWIPTRHGIFFVLYKAIWDSDKVVPEEGKGWDPAKGKFYTPGVIRVYLVALAIFQCLLIYWLILLLKAIKKSLQKSPLKDTRSDDSGSGSDSHED